MARVLKILGFLALVIVANWPYVYQEVLGEQIGPGVQLLQESTGASRKLPPTFAGWPFKFYQSVGELGELRVASFKWSAILLNICCWSLIPISFMLYEKYFFRRQAQSDKLEIEAEDSFQDIGRVQHQERTPEDHAKPLKPKRRSLQLADIFVVTAFIAGVFGFWQTLRVRGEQDKKLALEINSKGGAAKRVAMLPWLARDLLSMGGHSTCLRTAEVRLINPDDALLAKVVALPYLRTLNIAGGSYNFRTLDRLSTNPLFTELAIVGRQLNSDAISAIRSMQSLRKLNLMRTNITAAGLDAIGQSRLTELNLIHTDVQLSEIGTPAFSKTMRKLILPHPRRGGGDSLRLENWPELEEFSCYEYDELLNREPVELTLKNLPKLASVELDGLQLFDLDFEQLPNLSKLYPNYKQWEQRTTPKEVVPSFLWARKLRIKDVPKLKDLSIFCADTQSIQIDHDSLTLGMCVFNKGAERDGRSGMGLRGLVLPGAQGIRTEPGYLSHADIPLTTRQKWIDDLANCSGLETIDLELVPLSGVKLNSLVANKSIRQLMLGKSGLASSQLSELKGMDQLEELSLVGLDLDGRMIESLTKTLPNLRKIVCEQSFVPRLRLEHIRNLESLFEKPKDANQRAFTYMYQGMYQGQIHMDALKIVDAPKLIDQFVLGGPMLLLHIEAAPALSGLSFQEPLPANAIVNGVQNLKFFAAGGPTCTDAIVNEVLNCSGLQRLTLAYTNLLPTTLKRIAELRELEYLVLTGSKMDGQFVDSLASLEKLRTLRLDETPISQASVSAISKLKNLEVLDLGSLRLTSQDVSQLAVSLSKLKHVTLVGAELSAENMRQIAKLSSLQSLDLSECELNDELLNAFIESPPQSLAMLKMNSAKLGEVGFLNLVQKLRNARFALNDTSVNSQLMDSLVVQNRVTDFEGDDGPMGMRMRSGGTVYFNSAGGSYSVTQQINLSQLGDIDPQRFAPNYKDPRVEFEARMNSGPQFGNVDAASDGLDDGLGNMSVEQLDPQMTPFETLGYQLFKILNGPNAPRPDNPNNLE